MTHGLFLIANSKYRVLSTESSQITSCSSAKAIGNDCLDIQHIGCHYSLFCQESSHIIRTWYQRNLDIVLLRLILFCLSRYLGHGSYRFNRILSISSFSTQHQCIRTIINRIGDIGYFRACRTRIVNHRMKHLSSHNHRLLGQGTFLDKHSLNTRDFLLWHFDTQITTGNHHPIGHFQNFINIVYPFLVFNFSNDADIASIIIQYFTDIQYILFITHK